MYNAIDLEILKVCEAFDDLGNKVEIAIVVVDGQQTGIDTTLIDFDK